MGAFTWNFVTAIQIQTIKQRPIKIPGRTPAINSSTVPVLARKPQITRLMLGGMIGPIPDEAAVMATENPLSQPASFIALISRAPRPPASAIAEPDMPAKIILARTFAWPRPPGICPIAFSAKPNILSLNPISFIAQPTKTKAGTAKSEQLANDVAVFWANMTKLWPF